MPLHNKNYCTAVGFGTQKPMRSLCARHDILFRSVRCGIGVPAQGTVWPVYRKNRPEPFKSLMAAEALLCMLEPKAAIC